jgi:hypothetical protein
LIGLTLLAVIATAAPTWWLTCWRVAVAVLAILAPILGAARAARAVSWGAVEAEFARWFLPAETPSVVQETREWQGHPARR